MPQQESIQENAQKQDKGAQACVGQMLVVGCCGVGLSPREM